jgi:hypothetical protein
MLADNLADYYAAQSSFDLLPWFWNPLDLIEKCNRVDHSPYCAVLICGAQRIILSYASINTPFVAKQLQKRPERFQKADLQVLIVN